jgi:hypothetical protein
VADAAYGGVSALAAIASGGAWGTAGTGGGTTVGRTTDTTEGVTDTAAPSVHLTVGLDAHVWGLSYAGLRSMALRRRGKPHALNLAKLSTDAYWQLQQALPLGFLALDLPQAQAQDQDQAKTEAQQRASISAGLLARMRAAEPQRWADYHSDAELAARRDGWEAQRWARPSRQPTQRSSHRSQGQAHQFRLQQRRRDHCPAGSHVQPSHWSSSSVLRTQRRLRCHTLWMPPRLNDVEAQFLQLFRRVCCGQIVYSNRQLRLPRELPCSDVSAAEPNRAGERTTCEWLRAVRDGRRHVSEYGGIPGECTLER